MIPSKTRLALGLLVALGALIAPAAWAAGDEDDESMYGGGGGGQGGNAGGCGCQPAPGLRAPMSQPGAPPGYVPPAQPMPPCCAPGMPGAPPGPPPMAPMGPQGGCGMMPHGGMPMPPGQPPMMGMDGWRGRMGPGRGPMGTKALDLVIKPLYNLSDQRIYTLFGFENLRVLPNGWSGGWATYHGLNLGNSVSTDLLGHGGFLAKKRLIDGGVSLDVGGLVGMGYTLSATQTLGFSNFGIFAGVEPRVTLGWQVNPAMSLQLGASYLLTTRPAQAAGPALIGALSFGMPIWGR